jgi:hypothetical protein
MEKTGCPKAAPGLLQLAAVRKEYATHARSACAKIARSFSQKTFINGILTDVNQLINCFIMRAISCKAVRV